jgi:tRNA A-37 threonylcarbamoyl transferase component Bud32
MQNSLAGLCRLDLYTQVELLHQYGVEHGDLAPRNITRNEADGKLWLIDFSSSERHDECNGRDCPELVHFRQDLGLYDDV